VGAARAGFQYHAMQNEIGEYMDGLEISDLSVDCNAEGQTTRFIVTGAVAVGGRHIRIRRVRTFNFGSRTIKYVENFPLGVGSGVGTETYDAVIEDCIAEFPAHNNYNNSSVVLMTGGGEDARGDGVCSYARGCAIRNSYVDCGYYYGPKVRINSISYTRPDPNKAEWLVTLTTGAEHGKSTPGNILVSGVAANGVLERFNPDGTLRNPFVGVFAIETVESSTVLKYKITTDPSSYTPITGGILGGVGTSHQVSIKKIEAVNPAQ